MSAPSSSDSAVCAPGLPVTRAPAAGAAPGLRGSLERMSGRTLIGWLDDSGWPAGEAPAFSLVLAGASPQAATHSWWLGVTRLERPDVAQALGLPPGHYGFQAELDDTQLAALAQAQPDQAQLLVEGVALGGCGLAEAFARRLRDTQGRPLAAWERCQGLVLSGWVLDEPPGSAALALVCQGRPLGHPVLRGERQDVCGALGVSHPAPGFRIELPGQLWRDVPEGEDAQLVLLLDGQPLGAPVVLARQSLAAGLQPAQRPSDLKQDRLHCLLVMEHLVHAGLLATLPTAQRDALARLAADCGLPAQWGEAAAGAAGDAAPAPSWSGGRFSRWLRYRWTSALALRWLMRLRERQDPRAEEVEVALTQACGLFDKALYDRQVSEAQRGGLGSLRHYVRHGDALSIPANPLLSPRAYVSQLPGRRHPGINRLLHYALWGRFNGVSPSPWFNLPFYLARHPDVARSGTDPLLHFLRFGWAEQRQPFERFDLSAEGRQPLAQRLARQASAALRPDPLLDYLLRGLPPGMPLPSAGKLPWEPAREVEDIDQTDPARWADLRPRNEGARVDVVVPVYAGVQETLACLHSVLAAPVRTPFELVVVDDCSPDPALSAWLRELARRGLVTLLVNERNLGFVRTVNRALALHPDREVVILNADAMVFNDWLDRLLAHLALEPRAASVTPLSNNATICSYPRPLGDNGPIPADEAAALDRLAARTLAGHHAPAPSGVGFCMVMRRAVIEQIGPFDAEAFGRGYGEENDWCQRAIQAGWLNLLAADVYAVHQGSVSFADEADERVRAALAILEQRHPGYDKRVQAFIQQNPLAPARAMLDVQRLRDALAGAGLVMQISHARGGGTARHEQEQAERCESQGLRVAKLAPGAQPGTVDIGCTWLEELPNLAGLDCQPGGLLDQVLDALPLAALQLHHLADLPWAVRERLLRQVRERGVPLDVIVHDYHMACPRINLVTPQERYCGEPAPVGCDACLAQSPPTEARDGISPWREAHARLLAAASSVSVPDEDVAQRLGRYFPAVPVQVVPHEPGLRVSPLRRVAGEPRRILVVGALGGVKGYDVVLALARSPLARQRGVAITLLGYSKDDEALRAAGVEVLGRYEDSTLVERIVELAPDLLLLPSIWPETYCYVLSAAFQARVEVACFDIGAQARRLRAAGVPCRVLPLALAEQPEAFAAALLAPRLSHNEGSIRTDARA